MPPRVQLQLSERAIGAVCYTMPRFMCATCSRFNDTGQPIYLFLFNAAGDAIVRDTPTKAVLYHILFVFRTRATMEVARLG